jgi:enamine deaminase RidA (YjgF/YER057c/UK114 family)
MSRKHISSGTVWEPRFGYSRAVRVGSMVFVSGTLAADESGAIVGKGDAHAQTRYALAKIEKALIQAGSSLTDVVRTRMFIVRLEDAEAVGRAHGEVFGEIRPAATMVQVSGFVNPDGLVEIEADAVVV